MEPGSYYLPENIHMTINRKLPNDGAWVIYMDKDLTAHVGKYDAKDNKFSGGEGAFYKEFEPIELCHWSEDLRNKSHEFHNNELIKMHEVGKLIKMNAKGVKN